MRSLYRKFLSVYNRNTDPVKLLIVSTSTVCFILGALVAVLLCQERTTPLLHWDG